MCSIASSSASSIAQFRKQQPLFNAEERQGFLVEATSELGNVEIEIFSNLLVEFAREQGATAIVKGLRAISDFEFEFEMNQLNRNLAPDIESVYIIASPQLQLPLLHGGEGDGRLRRECLGPRAGVRSRCPRRAVEGLAVVPNHLRQ